MKLLINILFILIFALTSVQDSNAQNLHVTDTGSDATGNGTITNPFATMTEASNFITPGDTVFVHGGTYRNTDFGDDDIWKNFKIASIQCNGTPENYIVFMPFPGDEVLLEYDSQGVVILNSSYVKFMRFNIKGPGENISDTELQEAWGLYKDSDGVLHNLASEMGIDITNPDLLGQTIDKPETLNVSRPNYYNSHALLVRSCQHVIIENNNVSWASATGIRIQKCDYTIVQGNEISYCTMRTVAGVGALTMAECDGNGDYYGNTIVGNNVHHNENRIYSWAPSKSFVHFVIDEGSGIFLTRNNLSNLTINYTYIANNLSYNNGASGIVIHYTSGVIVEHNTVYNNGETNGESKPGGIGFNNAVDVTFRNNISWSKPNKFALGQVGGGNSNLVFENNLLFNNNGVESVVKNVTEGYTEANPEFVDIQSFDFHLQSSSPAINMGTETALVTTDFDGFERLYGEFDIGAYEYNPTITVVKELLKVKTYVYPNPAKETLYIQAKNIN